MKRLLSICIPTYNRKIELAEIIDSLLTIKSDEFEIVITDNVSTDGTKEMVLSYSDQRVRYCGNEKPLPPFVNMIHSIFNGCGHYALYCNDRDVLYPQGITSLLTVLRQNEFAFLCASSQKKASDNEISVYEQGFESLMHNNCIHHPTGMIYNRDLMGNYLNENDYEKYLQYINTYDFLMLDLFLYGKSAQLNTVYWGTRPVEFIKKNKSGTQIYFFPETREKMFYGVVSHIFLHNDYKLTFVQKKRLLKKIYKEFCMLFCKYKSCMADENETAHYGIEQRRISCLEMLKIYQKFFGRSIAYLNKKNFDGRLVRYIKANTYHFSLVIIKTCLKIELINIYKKITS